jgi:hypothetical protein
MIAYPTIILPPLALTLGGAALVTRAVHRLCSRGAA